MLETQQATVHSEHVHAWDTTNYSTQ